jgi:hypothetical protein
MRRGTLLSRICPKSNIFQEPQIPLNILFPDLIISDFHFLPGETHNAMPVRFLAGCCCSVVNSFILQAAAVTSQAHP